MKLLTSAAPKAPKKVCKHDSTRSDGGLDTHCLLCGIDGFWHEGHRHDVTHPSGKILFVLECIDPPETLINDFFGNVWLRSDLAPDAQTAAIIASQKVGLDQDDIGYMKPEPVAMKMDVSEYVDEPQYIECGPQEAEAYYWGNDV